MARAEQAACALCERQRAVGHLDLRMGFAAQLAHRFDHLGDAAAVGRVVVAQAAAVGVERQLADARDLITIRHKLAAFAFFAKAEIFKLHQDSDGETVVD